MKALLFVALELQNFLPQFGEGKRDPFSGSSSLHGRSGSGEATVSSLSSYRVSGDQSFGHALHEAKGTRF